VIICILLFSQFSLADSLYANNYYETAYIEYKRIFFFYPDFSSNIKKRINYANSLLKIDKTKGLYEMKRIVDEFPEMEPEALVKIAKCYLNAGNFYEASKLLLKTDEERLLGLSYLLDGRLVSARNSFTAGGDYKIAEEIDEFIRKPKTSQRTAALLSLFCPGAGEVYAGDVKLGIKDFLLTGGSVYLIYNAVKKKKYIDAILIFNLLFNRFYFGSIYNARKTAIEKNKKERLQLVTRLKNTYFKRLLTNSLE